VSTPITRESFEAAGIAVNRVTFDFMGIRRGPIESVRGLVSKRWQDANASGIFSLETRPNPLTDRGVCAVQNTDGTWDVVKFLSMGSFMTRRRSLGRRVSFEKVAQLVLDIQRHTSGRTEHHMPRPAYYWLGRRRAPA
jgi:hypothetical protein